MDKFILRGDKYSLNPIRYPWAVSMTEHGRKNNWTPQEVQMGRDKACYEQDLSPAERFMFIHVFGSLTTSDQAVAENLLDNVGRLLHAAELRGFVTRQAEEEGIHSLSYQHVLEVLNLDKEEIEGLYQRVPEIAQWFDWVQAVTSINDITFPLMFFYAFYEGVFFPTAFAAIYSLQRRRLMTGTGEQIQYIHRDETVHIGFGIRLINEIFAELAQKPSQESVHRLFENSMKRLDTWADHCIPDLLGYNASLHKQHARYLADRRLKALGYEPKWKAESVLPWLDEQASIKKEKNFFETRVTEYQSGTGLSFESSGSMADIVNWR
ncbi:MAG: Ribonucleoside-diphosphate reductase subunit beta [Pseudomonadota bacterium]|jgi:ribonucleoside-diphosphate reductase beta chain